MNSSNNSFFLIPFLIVAFAAIAFAENSHEEVVHPPVKNDEKANGVNQVHNVEQAIHTAVQNGNNANEPENKLKHSGHAGLPPLAVPPRSPNSPSRNGRGGRFGHSNSFPTSKSLSPKAVNGVNWQQVLDKAKESDKNGENQNVPSHPEDHDKKQFNLNTETHNESVHEIDTNDESYLKRKETLNNLQRVDPVELNLEPISEDEEYKPINEPHQPYPSLYYGARDVTHTLDQHDLELDNHNKRLLQADFGLRDINTKHDNHVRKSTQNFSMLAVNNGHIGRNVNALHRIVVPLNEEFKITQKGHKELDNKFNEHTAKYNQDMEKTGKEMKEIEAARKKFEEETFVDYKKGIENQFKEKDKRMDGIDTRANQLETTQNGYGQDIRVLRKDVDNHGVVADNLKRRIKQRKLENSENLRKQMELLKHQNDVHEKSQAIINHVWDYGQELPEIFVKQLDINRAYQTFLNVNEMTKKVAEENQKKLLETEKKLEEERQKMLLAKDAIEMEAVHKEEENRNKILQAKQEKILELENKTKAKQNEILGEKQQIELKTTEEAKEHAENVKAANDALNKAINDFEEALKKLADEENMKKRIEAFEKLKGEHKDTIDTKMKALKEDENKREEAKKQRKIERDARKAEAAKMTAAAAARK